MVSHIAASVYTVRNATGLVHSSQSASDAVQFAVDDLPYYASVTYFVVVYYKC